MAITEWQAAIATLTRGTGLKVYKSNEQPNNGKLVALYGKPGVGKTTLLRQLADSPHTRPLLYINIEGGAWVLSDRDDMTIVDINQYSDFGTLSRKLFQLKELPFKSIAIDNGSELQALNIMSIMGQGGGINAAPGMVSQQQWGASTAQLLNVVRGYHELTRRFPVTVVITAWEDLGKDAGEVAYRRGIGFTPALARSLPGIVDIVGHITVKNDSPHYTRVINFASNPLSDAKFRRNDMEAARDIPQTIAYRKQPVLMDILATLMGGSPWPKAKYETLSAQANVTQVPVPEPQSQGVVETAVAQRMSSDEQTEKETP